MIDQHILKEGKARWKNTAMTWIDYKKVYDYSPAILNNRFYEVIQDIIKLIMEAMKPGKQEEKHL